MLKPIKYSIGLDYWQVFIEYRSEGKWAVVFMGDAMNHDGEFDFENSPSNRTEEYILKHRFNSPEEALQCFKEKSNLVINGQSIKVKEE